MRPALGSITAPRHLSRVLLPEPDGPISPTTSPGATAIFTSLSASTAVSPWPYRLRRPSMRMPFPAMSTSYRFGRIDAQRSPDGDCAGQHANHQNGRQAGERVLRNQQHVFGEGGRHEGGGDLAHHEPDHPQPQRLLNDHAGNR